MLDEVPWNSDSKISDDFISRHSGDWSGIKCNGINLMMSFKPVADADINPKGLFKTLVDKILSRDSLIKLSFPEDIPQIDLNKVFRCTQNITKFYEIISNELNDSYRINHDSSLYTPGHEIHGNTPEVLLIPQCKCRGEYHPEVENDLR